MTLNSDKHNNYDVYCILHGQIKGCNSSIAAIICPVGSTIDTFLSKETICLFNKCVKDIVNKGSFVE